MSEESTDSADGDRQPERRADAASPEKVEALARQFDERGHPYAKVTVVRREAPVSANVGDRALVTANGEVVGWIGGAACAQSVVVDVATEALETGEATLVGLAPDPDTVDRPGVESYPMTCHSGGSLELFVDPVVPTPRLVVIGDSAVSRALTGLAGALTYQVSVVTDADAPESGADEVVDVGVPDALAESVEQAWAVVVASMGEYDHRSLAAALRADPAYVGLIASDERHEALTDEVAVELGVDPETVREAVTTPAGLDIGAQTAEEIAVSVLAELVAVRRGADVAPDRAATSLPEGRAAHVANGDRERAIDPVCGMDVVVQDAAANVEHDGDTYHFCSEGCAAAFETEPGKYLDAQTAVDD